MGTYTVVIAYALLAIAFAHHEKIDSTQQVRVKQLYDLIFTPDYVPYLRPYSVNSTGATNIRVQFSDINVINVDEVKGQMTFQAYFRQEWVDSRLAYNDTAVNYIPVIECKKMFVPDSYFLNGVETPVYGKPARLMKIYPNGRVFYSQRLTQTVTCPSIFNTEQNEFSCLTLLGSYGYFSDEIQYDFMDVAGISAISANQRVLPPRFTFQDVTSARCDNKKARSNDLDGHLHSCLSLNFRLTRNIVKKA